MNPLPDAVVAHLIEVVRAPDLSGTRYDLVRQIGRGGMGTVYLVFDRVLERQAALKVIGGTEAVEARVMAGLEHPGIVPVYDAGTLPDGRPYYVMRFVEGARLDEFRRNTPGLVDRLRVFEKICDAVAFAHHSGILHRDLKPANIIVGRFGEVFVLDWGVGLVAGTPPYMAPEQAAGQGDARADIYSLGVVLDFLLDAGKPRPLHAVAGKAASPRPEGRYQTPTAMIDEIQRYLAGEAVEAYKESWAEALLRFCSRNKTLLLLMAAYLVVKFALYFLRRS